MSRQSDKNEHETLLKSKTCSCPLQNPGIKTWSCNDAQHLHIPSFVPLTLHTHTQAVTTITGTQRGLILDRNNSRRGPDRCKHMAQAGLKQQARQQALLTAERSSFFWKHWITTFLILSSGDTYILNSVTKTISRQTYGCRKRYSASVVLRDNKMGSNTFRVLLSCKLWLLYLEVRKSPTW